MGERLGQGQRLLTPPHGLRRIAQAPQRVGRHGQAPHPRRPRHCRSARARCIRRVGEGDPLLQVRPGGGVFAQIEQGAPERFVGLQAGMGSAARCASRTELFPNSRAVGNAPGCDRTDINPAASGRAGASPRRWHTTPGRGRRSAPPRGRRPPWVARNAGPRAAAGRVPAAPAPGLWERGQQRQARGRGAGPLRGWPSAGAPAARPAASR